MKKNSNSVMLVHHSLAVLITWKTKPYREGRQRNRVTPLYLDNVGTRVLEVSQENTSMDMGNYCH